MRSRNMAEKLISLTPSYSPSSTALLHSRMRGRFVAAVGIKGGSGKIPSIYSQINVDSMTAEPSCTSVGTTPFGLSFR